MAKKILTFLSLMLFNFLIVTPEEWDVNKPKGTFNNVNIDVDEGTWMNLDVSPDGKQIVFDLLGDIYIIPIEGGNAKQLRSGLAWEVQPRFSPDGKQICFTSDAGGGDNIWTMKTDGSEAKQITKEDFRLLNNTVWSPDGEFLITRKHFTGTRSAGAGEIWMYHISGGSGVGLTKRKNDQQDVNEPCISKDGRYIYFSEDMYPGGSFQYNKDPNKQIYIVRRFDRNTGKIENIVTGGGGAFRPQISNSGELLAFVRRVRTKTVMFIHNLKTGEEYPIYDSLTKDQSEAWALFGVYPNYQWTPDDKSIIFWANGKINKLTLADKSLKNIEFKVSTKHIIYDALKFKQNAYEDNFTVKAIRNAVTSPDGKTLIFNAAGFLYKKTLPDGNPIRITNSEEFEFEPCFNPIDNNEIIFVRWSDDSKGKIILYNLVSNTEIPLHKEKGIYRTPSFSNDGKSIVYVKESGNDHQGYSFCKNPGIYIVDKNNKDHKYLEIDGEFPSFNKNDSRIYYQTGGYLFGDLDKGFHSCDLNGKDILTHFKSKYTNRFVPSPDGKWIAFNELHKLYIARFNPNGISIDLSKDIKDVPVACVSKDAGISPHWSNNSMNLYWTLGDRYFSTNLENTFGYLTGKNEFKQVFDSIGSPINLILKSNKPNKNYALTNATIITMNGSNKVIENGTIIIKENIIEQIGENIPIPNGVEIIDCKGKTIMPGLVDVHAHLGTFRYGISPTKHWQYWANLAYGVTTTHDPSSNTEMVFSQSEMIKSGAMLGPRVFSTGVILYGADGDFKAVINNLADAESAIRRTKAFGAFSVKSYNQPRRNQRQQVIQAARNENIMVVPEGGSHFYHNLSMIADGHTGIEHNIPVAPLYNDVIQFWSGSKTANTPTLIVSYGSVSGENKWYQKTDVWTKNKLYNFTPRNIIDGRSRHRTMIPDEEYENGHILISKQLKKLTDAGVKINMGSHGQIQGIGAHWEIWMLAEGGMTNYEALKAATINGAEYIGMSHQIGSLEKGKLADIIVLDKNPLDNIQNTESIIYTIINGEVYYSESMKKYFDNSQRANFWFENEKYDSRFDWHEDSNNLTRPNCSCGH